MARNTGFGWLVLIAMGIGWCSNQSDKTTSSTASSRPVQPSAPSPASPATPAQPVQNVSIAPRTVTPPAPTAATTTLYTTANVRLRAEPSTGSGIILTVPSGSAVTSTKLEGTWHYVTYGNYTGWIRGDYLATRRPTPQRTAPSTAMPLVGAPSRPRATQPARSSSRSGYIRGPRGGCYYINRNGNKTYVDRSMCN